MRCYWALIAGGEKIDLREFQLVGFLTLGNGTIPMHTVLILTGLEEGGRGVGGKGREEGEKEEEDMKFVGDTSRGWL